MLCELQQLGAMTTTLCKDPFPNTLPDPALSHFLISYQFPREEMSPSVSPHSHEEAADPLLHAQR